MSVGQKFLDSTTPGIPDWFKTAGVELESNQFEDELEIHSFRDLYDAVVINCLVNQYHLPTLMRCCGDILSQIDGVKFENYAETTLTLYDEVVEKFLRNTSSNVLYNCGSYRANTRQKIISQVVFHWKMTCEIKRNRKIQAARKIQQWWKEEIRYNPEHPICQKWMRQIQSQWDKM